MKLQESSEGLVDGLFLSREGVGVPKVCHLCSHLDSYSADEMLLGGAKVYMIED